MTKRSNKYWFMDERSPAQDLLDELDYARALADAEPPTAAELASNARIMRAVRRKLAEACGGLHVVAERGHPPAPRPSILSLDRWALVARLEAVVARSTSPVRFAHRELTALTDSELRDLVIALERQSRQKPDGTGGN